MRRSSNVVFGLGIVTLSCVLGTSAQDIMPTPTPAPSPHPVAATTTASADDGRGNIAANTLDGNLATHWSADGNGAWIEYDLGTTVRVWYIRMAALLGDQRRNQFEILLSTNRTTWTTAFSGQSSGSTTQLETFAIGHRDARYVRYVGHGNVSNSGARSASNSLTEAIIYTGQNPSRPVPQNLRAQAIQDAGAIFLRWTAPPNPGTTRVFRSLTRGGPYTFLAHVAPGATQYNDMGLQNAVQYCYVLTDRLGVQESRYSNESCAVATVLPTPMPPPIPTGLTARPGLSDCVGNVTPMRLSWNPSPGAQSYNVLRSSSSSGPFAHVANVAATEWLNTTVGAAYYVVNAANRFGVSGFSSPVFGTFAIPSCPAPPMKVPIPPANVRTSGDDGNVGANTVDNDLGTRWSAFGEGAWIQYDLGRPRLVAYVRLAVFGGDSRKNSFTLQASSDGTSWAPLLDGQTSGTTTALERFNLPYRSTRYIRYLGHGHVPTGGVLNRWNSLTEVEIFALGQ